MVVEAHSSHTIIKAVYVPADASIRVSGAVTTTPSVSSVGAVLEQGNVTVNAASELILAANASRVNGVLLQNVGVYNVNIAYGTAAQTTHITLKPNAVLKVPTTDAIYGICTNATGSRIEYVGL